MRRLVKILKTRGKGVSICLWDSSAIVGLSLFRVKS